jgi:hypothetical protein
VARVADRTKGRHGCRPFFFKQQHGDMEQRYYILERPKTQQLVVVNEANRRLIYPKRKVLGIYPTLQEAHERRNELSEQTTATTRKDCWATTAGRAVHLQFNFPPHPHDQQPPR